MNANPSLLFSDLHLHQLRTCGWTRLDRFITHDEVLRYRTELVRLAAEADAAGRHPAPGVSLAYEAGFDPVGKDAASRDLGVRKYFEMAQADPFFWSTARDPRIRSVLDRALGPGARLLQSMALVKPPEIGSAKDWHQDVPYFPLDRLDRCLGFWIALDDATPDNGCMQFVDGSHHGGMVAHEQGPTGWRFPQPLVAEATARAVPVPVPAGTALVFDARTWHFTDINRTQSRRRAYQYHYVSADTRSCADHVRLHDLTAHHPPRIGS